MSRAKEIVIVSGKGGTGKTTLTGSLSKLLENKVICDADVDAADMFLLLQPQVKKTTPFKGKSIAVIDHDKCVNCSICQKVCRFDAVYVEDGNYEIDPYSCDGCTYCKLACPTDAITMEQQTVGKWFVSSTDYGEMIHAKLTPGAENSGNLVTMVKVQAHNIAREKKIPYVLVDGPPGIGCPVTSALSGASLAIVVTEPTFSGMHDLERVHDLTKHFNVSSAIVINKFDLNIENAEEIERLAKQRDIPVIGKIPFDSCIVEAITNNLTPVDVCDELKPLFSDILDRALSLVG